MKAIKYCRYVYAQGYTPIAPHLYFTRFLDDSNPEEREWAIAQNKKIISDCDELWIFGSTLSIGMQKEICHAIVNGITIRTITL